LAPVSSRKSEMEGKGRTVPGLSASLRRACVTAAAGTGGAAAAAAGAAAGGAAAGGGAGGGVAGDGAAGEGTVEAVVGEVTLICGNTVGMLVA